MDQKNTCMEIVKKEIDRIVGRTFREAMEKPRLLRIIFKLLSSDEISYSSNILHSQEIKQLYSSDPMLTSSYNTVAGELYMKYFHDSARFSQCIKKMNTLEYKSLHDYIDKKIKTKLKKLNSV